MSNIKMMHNKHFDNAELSTVGVNELMPITNVQVYDNSEAFRTDSKGNIIIRIRFPKLTFISGLVLWRHNLSATSTIQWKGYTSNDFTGSPIFDTGEQQAIAYKALGEMNWGVDPLGATIYDEWDTDKKATELWIAEKAVMTQEIIIKDADNTSDFIDIVRIYNGLALSPMWNFSEGVQAELNPVNDDAIQTADGSYHTVESDIYRLLKFAINYLSESERPLFVEFARQVGVHKDFFVSLYPTAGGQKQRDHAFAAKFTNIPSTTSRAIRYASSYIAREV